MTFQFLPSTCNYVRTSDQCKNAVFYCLYISTYVHTYVRTYIHLYVWYCTGMHTHFSVLCVLKVLMFHPWRCLSLDWYDLLLLFMSAQLRSAQLHQCHSWCVCGVGGGGGLDVRHVILCVCVCVCVCVICVRMHTYVCKYLYLILATTTYSSMQTHTLHINLLCIRTYVFTCR